MIRICAMVSMAWWLTLAPAFGMTRLASVYIESPSVLQRQCDQAAQLFETPELGSAPTMINAMIPGFAQLDRDAPVGLHVYTGTGLQFGMVIEVKPTVAIGDFLGVLLARQGTAVPEPVDGRYVTNQGTAQVHGDRVLIARSVQDLELALQAGIPTALPVVPGVFRIDIRPKRFVKVLEALETMVPDAMADDAGQREMLKEMLDMYRSGLPQIGVLQHGLGVSTQGLEFRSRMVPQPRSALERIVQSLQGVNPAWLSRLNGDHVIGMVSGAYEIPDEVLQQILNYYVDMMQTFSPEISMEPAFMREMLEPSFATLGSPSFLFGGLGANGKLAMYGGMQLDDAAPLLAKTLALMNSEPYQIYSKASGMKVSVPEERIVKDHKVYRWKMEIEEEAFIKHLQQSGSSHVAPEEAAQFKKLLDMFLTDYNYAAIEQGLVFGVTDDAGISQAMQLLSETEGHAATILKRIGAPVTPYIAGRFDLPGILGMAQKMGATFLPALPIKGEGALFAGWRTGNALEHVFIMPAADVRAIKNAAANQ